MLALAVLLSSCAPSAPSCVKLPFQAPVFIYFALRRPAYRSFVSSSAAIVDCDTGAAAAHLRMPFTSCGTSCQGQQLACDGGTAHGTLNDAGAAPRCA